ncbi:MAG: HTTM domain-containing protein [Moraxellaceae bacterium]|nr:HTTM domain-containing protein [Pseudobdellovibrionaceae bacterium]
MFSLVSKSFLAAAKKINDFLFKNISFEQLGLTRIILCGTLLFLACSRQFNMDQYGLESIIPREKALLIYPEFYRPAFQYFFWPDVAAPYVHFGLIILLLMATFGLSNRILMLITWIISQGFINRNYSMLFGADLIGTLFLFYLSFTYCHEAYSIKRFFNKNIKTPQISENSFSMMVSSVFLRLMQFQLAVIYMYTGFEKLKGSTWWDGTALWTVFANPQFVNYDFIFLRHFPLIFAVGTFITLLFEVYFPAMMLFKTGRYIYLSLGVFFHLMIGFLLSLMPFSLVMIAVYPLYLERKDIDFILSSCRSMISKLSHFKTV